MKLSQYTIELLNDIEARIDPETENDYLLQWNNFWDNSLNTFVFKPMRKKTTSPKLEIKAININDALEDFELMLDRELQQVSNALKDGRGALAIRSNYGTGILSSVLGAKVFVMPRENDTLPTTKPYESVDAFKGVMDGGIPDLNNGFGKKVFTFGEYAREVFKSYPKIEKYVEIYHPDTQGPLDIAELLLGGELFYLMYDEPEFTHEILTYITNTYTEFLDKWFALCPAKEKLNAHWNLLIKGKICLRDDSAMNISPEFYKEFAFKYDKYLLDYYNGGMVHFCGRGDHYIELLASASNLTSINLSQPHLNDMNVIYNAVHNNNKKILALDGGAAYEYEKREDKKTCIIHG